MKPGLRSSASTAAATGRPSDDAGGEAGLSRGRARVALLAGGGFEAGGQVAQEPGQVAARVSLQQDPGHQRVPGRAAARAAQPLEHRLGRRAQRERARGGAQRMPGRPLQRCRDRASAPRTE